MKLDRNLREFVALLNSTKVRYLLVGGHAVAFHGYPRFTGDIDFFVERSPENAARLVTVIRGFGFGHLNLQETDFLQPGVVIQLGRPPNRIDILTSIDGVEFADAWEGRVAAELDRLPLDIIGKAELIQNKRSSGRAQDRADLSRLEAPASS
ncbi:MAG TPA: hypothetical protein VMS21_04725 [Methylomirabilota bacterium]|nr:hypothetical protein [Methylomirabilota bacterium]